MFREGWQRAIEEVVKFLWRSDSPSGYRDGFPGSSLLGQYWEILIRQMGALVRRAWRRFALS